MSTPPKPAIEHIRIADLKPWARNARTHSKKQVRQIADSITEFGFTNPVLIDGSNSILAGHGRVQAATLLEISSVPCVRLEHMSAAQKRAYVLADNKLALNAGWDDTILAEELQALLTDESGIDISLTGFTIAEVDHLIEDAVPQEDGDPADDVLPDQSDNYDVCPGDIWQLGPHRLICGDALDAKDVDLLMDGKRA